ncbi:hypothetical protein ACK3SF_00490 [Candidatus Nanosalina sp. VS9-1]|uniref:hypothetical protein n=1 Tax=Candidatus Nanosalina sp. VS9-1 TaxID=3388566 RepID=UPI0039DF90DF
MVQSFGGLMETLTGIDFFTGLLPFVITYTVFFFILRYLASEVLFDGWDDNKPDQFAAILSIAFAFFTANFILNQPWAAAFFSQYLGRLTVIIVGLLGLLALLGFVGIDLDSSKTGVGWVMALLVIAAFAVSGGVSSILPVSSRNAAIAYLSNGLTYMIDSGLIFLVLIAGLLYYTMRDPSSGSSERMQWFTPFGGVQKGGDDEDGG